MLFYMFRSAHSSGRTMPALFQSLFLWVEVQYSSFLSVAAFLAVSESFELWIGNILFTKGRYSARVLPSTSDRDEQSGPFRNCSSIVGVLGSFPLSDSLFETFAELSRNIHMLILIRLFERPTPWSSLNENLFTQTHQIQCEKQRSSKGETDGIIGTVWTEHHSTLKAVILTKVVHGSYKAHVTMVTLPWQYARYFDAMQRPQNFSMYCIHILRVDL